MSHLVDDRRWRSGAEFHPPVRTDEVLQQLKSKLPELLELEYLIQMGGDALSYRIEAQIPLTVKADSQISPLVLPIYSVVLGNPEALGSSKKPSMLSERIQSERTRGACLMTAGMHGVERIGTQVLLGFLRAIIERRRWDGALQELIGSAFWVLIPILNPGGMFLNWRANPNGVDLNRNSPIEAQRCGSKKPLWMGGGQTFSANLPWFRGHSEQGLEVENQALQRILIEDLSRFAVLLALDLHSGFGGQDRLWFPYAYRRRPIDALPEFMALKLLWENSFPPQAYQFEPQSAHYLAHGDMWDYLYRKLRDEYGQTLLPLTLEMGSWRWLKKRPLHVFRRSGLFHPLVPRRVGRACRDHFSFLMFMLHAAVYLDAWLPSSKQMVTKNTLDSPIDSRKELTSAALALWYPDLM